MIPMEIRDLTETHHNTFFLCLEDWSDEIKEAGNHKEFWYDSHKDTGLRVKIAIEDNTACGMIQYEPSEQAFIEARDLYFIKCIWVHGHKQGIGNYQKKGIGKALLQAAEADVRSMHKKGMVAWGLSMPIWMKASWYRKQGYKKVDNNSIAQLVWKPFTDDAIPPKWIKEKKRPQKKEGMVTVTSFINGWCPGQNLVYERARRAALSFGDLVDFQEIRTSDRDVLLEWGIADALFIDGKQIRTGPPPSYDKIVRQIEKRVKKLKKSKR